MKCTNDKKILKQLDKAEKMQDSFGIFFLAGLLGIIPGCFGERIPWLCILSIIWIILFFGIGLYFRCAGEELELQTINEFKLTDEYKNQQIEHIKQQEEKIKKEKETRASNLINIFDALNNTSLSKEEKIDVISNYIDKK